MMKYKFERYFVVNYRTGEIAVNPGATERDQQRAQLIIEIYALNEHSRPQSRLLEAKKYRSLPADEYVLYSNQLENPSFKSSWKGSPLLWLPQD